MGKLYNCKRCKRPRAAVMTGNAEKVKRMGSGYIARFLECGHTGPVTDKPVRCGRCGSEIRFATLEELAYLGLDHSYVHVNGLAACADADGYAEAA